MTKTNKKVKNLTKEFKAFTTQTAILSTAVGIMIGAALKDVIDSLVQNILTPPINYLTSGIDFSDLYVVLGNESYESIELAKEAGAVVIEYGAFINSLFSFLIISLVLFIIVNKGKKILEKNFKKEEDTKKKTTKICPYCFSEVNIKATKCPYCTSKLE